MEIITNDYYIAINDDKSRHLEYISLIHYNEKEFDLGRKSKAELLNIYAIIIFKNDIPTFDKLFQNKLEALSYMKTLVAQRQESYEEFIEETKPFEEEEKAEEDINYYGLKN